MATDESYIDINQREINRIRATLEQRSEQRSEAAAGDQIPREVTPETRAGDAVAGAMYDAGLEIALAIRDVGAAMLARPR